MVQGGAYNVKDSTTRRAWLTLMVEGINEDPYTLEYTVDNKPGTGENALQVIDRETSTIIYNWELFYGCEYMSEEMFSGQYAGNFPSGSSATLKFLDTRSGRHPSMGSVSFLSPKLEPGKHIINYTITNSYGDVITNTDNFVIQDKPQK